MFPDIEEFKAILLSQGLDKVVERHLFQGTPFVFREDPGRMDLLRRHLAESLTVREDHILIVGSAKMGFSLSPDTFPRRFSPVSDIDVLVYDKAIFDRIWGTVLRWHYPTRHERLEGADRQWVGDRKRDIYWGWLKPDGIRYEGLSLPERLVPVRDISSRWFDAFRSLSLYPEFADRHVSGRLYRTLGHARLYHVDGLRRIRESLK